MNEHLECGYEVTVTRLVRMTATVPVVATSAQDAVNKAEQMVRDGEVTAWTEQMTEHADYTPLLKLDTRDGQAIKEALGQDIQACHLILSVLAKHGLVDEATLAFKLKLDPLEVARLMAKMRRLGLVC